MKDYTVADFMTPAKELVSVGQDADMYEAAARLDEAVAALPPGGFHTTAILVLDQGGTPVGMLSMLDLVTGLEPKYASVQGPQVSRFGLPRSYMETMFRQYGLWENSLENICRRAGKIRVREIMTPPAESEVVHLHDSLSMAVHQMALGHHHNLLVKDAAGAVCGLLRLADVYGRINGMLQSCRLERQG